MAKRRGDSNTFNIAFLDLLSGALGAVIILFIAVPKGQGDDESVVESLKKNYEKVVRTTNKEKTVLKIKIDELKKKLQEKDEQYAKVEEEQKKMMEIIREAKGRDSKREIASISSAEKIDVGFKFKGRNIVFVIDVSGSMKNEDRLGQVKAGLKMLISAMGDEYKVDVVYYPDKRGGNLYKALYRDINPVIKSTRSEIFDFIHKLISYGPTPTRAVLKYVLGNYEGVTDIVLLSDGAPTVGNTRQFDDIFSVIAEVKETNVTDVQINTIGVGSDFLTDVQNNKYIFLEKLAKDSNGFFIGF